MPHPHPPPRMDALGAGSESRGRPGHPCAPEAAGTRSAGRRAAVWIAQGDGGAGRHGARQRCRRAAPPSAASAVCAVAAALVLCAPPGSAYLIKSFMHWERVGAFPQYITQKPSGSTWPRSRHCWNGPCGKNTPDYLCNPDCGNPNIGMTDDTKYPKAFLIRIVSAQSLPMISSSVASLTSVCPRR